MIQGWYLIAMKIDLRYTEVYTMQLCQPQAISDEVVWKVKSGETSVQTETNNISNLSDKPWKN